MTLLSSADIQRPKYLKWDHVQVGITSSKLGGKIFGHDDFLCGSLAKPVLVPFGAHFTALVASMQ